MFNFLKRDIPDWVKSYPDELDRQTLLTLVRTSKGDFSKSREMNYVLLGDLAQVGNMKEILSLLENEGWKVTNGELLEHQTFFIVAQNENYFLAPETYGKDVKFFREIASKYAVEYDGWFASN